MNNDNHSKGSTTLAPDMEEVRLRFESWRKNRTKRTRIPQSLWDAAVSLSGEHSISHLSKVLRVNYTALKKQVVNSKDSLPKPLPVFPASFFELPVPEPLPESTIEVARSDGAVMRMQLKGITSSDLLALGKSFWANDS